MGRIILVTGGQRSGKSSYAESLAHRLTDRPVYMATAHVWDDEFRQRVIKHQENRGPEWTNVEEELFLSRHDVSGRVVLVDCVTLWCTNFFTACSDIRKTLTDIKSEFDKFTSQDATFIFVTNEIGMGGIAVNQVQRQFTDLQGWVNQYIATKAEQVVLMISGIPVTIKGYSTL